MQGLNQSHFTKSVCILGATGSIGDSTLSVIRKNPHHFKVHSLVAHKNVDKMLKLCIEFKPEFVIMADENAAGILKSKIDAHSLKINVLSGFNAINEMVTHPDIDIVVAAIVGSRGLISALAAVKAAKTILLANKESLVMGGTIFMDSVKRYGAKLLPIDSEHNALFQCLPKNDQGNITHIGVNQLILTASGGPFRTKTVSEMKQVTLNEALKHPKWVMGAKVTLDSASLMNKGLELIEAHFLFDMPVEKLDVIVHPQSIVHSLVRYTDGSFLAQLGEPDMRIPIAHALSYAHSFPNRIPSGANNMDLSVIASLTFEKPDYEKFPCLQLAFDSLKLGGSALVTLNAANEIAVESLMQDRLQFMDVPRIINQSLMHFGTHTLTTLEDLLGFDDEVRKYTQQLLATF